MDTEATRWVTVARALPQADGAVAVIVARPSATAVTTPAESTKAITGAELDQVTGIDITSPYWSFTSAVRREASPKDAKSTDPG